MEDPENVTAYLTDLEIGSDGAIYVSGFNNLNSDFKTTAIVKKFKTNGNPDNSFNMTGSASHPGTANGGMAHAITVDGSGKVFIAGSEGTADNKDLFFGAFDANGEHDGDFTRTDKIVGTTHGELLDMIRLSDGTFIACGYALGEGQTYGILRKYKADGTIETSFNAGGSNFIRHNSEGNSRAVVVQSDGKILVGGVYLQNGTNTGLVVARFNSDGTPDLSFGTYGYARHDLSDRREFLEDLHVYPDGKILLGGTMNDATYGDDFLVVKLNPDGSLDESFGNNGFVKRHVGAYAKHNTINALTVDAEGRILIAGEANYNGGSYFDATLMRLLPDGNPDPDFATNGLFTINLTVVNDYFYDVAVGNDGSIYAVGYGLVNVGGAVVKLNEEGEIDTSFGTEGVFYTDWEEGYISHALQIQLQSDGKLVIACSQQLKQGTPQPDAFVYRLLPSGDVDETFGESGIAEVPFTDSQNVYGLVIDDQGVIYMSGSRNGNFYLSKIDTDGQLISPFIVISEFTSRTNIDINKANGNIYTGANGSGFEGIAVACIGTGGSEEEEEENECDELDNPTISNIGEVLYASDADSYQWYASGELLEGETNQSLVINAAAGGVYAVEVTIGSCVLFSDDFEYRVTGIREENVDIRIYPNPTKENILIESTSGLNDAKVSLRSLTTNSIQQITNLSGKRSVLSLEHVPAGIYILTVQSAARTRRIKIIKQN